MQTDILQVCRRRKPVGVRNGAFTLCICTRTIKNLRHSMMSFAISTCACHASCIEFVNLCIVIMQFAFDDSQVESYLLRFVHSARRSHLRFVHSARRSQFAFLIAHCVFPLFNSEYFAFQRSRPLHPSMIFGNGCNFLGLFCPALCTLLRFVDSAGPEVVGMSCILYRLFLNFKLS